MTFPNVSDEVRLAPVAPRLRLATDVRGAVAYTGQSRAQLYKDMRAGRVAAYKNGARTILFFEDLDRYLRALPRATFKAVDGVEPEARAAQSPAGAGPVKTSRPGRNRGGVL